MNTAPCTWLTAKTRIMEKPDTWDRIDDYLLNKMTPAERRAFEKELAQDVDLQSNLQIQRELLNGLQAFKDKQSFFEMLDKVPVEEGPASAKQKPQLRTLRQTWIPAIAAAIALFLVFYLIWPGTQPDPDALLVRYYKLTPTDELAANQQEALGFGGVDNPERDSLISQAIAAHQAADYPAARKMFIDIHTALPDKESLLAVFTGFHAGQLALHAGNAEQALAYLLPIEVLGGTPVRSDIQYTIALAYIKQKNYKEAIRFLEKIPKDFENAMEVKALLQTLK